LVQNGHTVINPALSDDDFAAALSIAQAEFDKHTPDVIVGSSRGGALAMNLEAGETPLVLLCPAWKKYGTAKTIRANSTILHSRADDIVPYADSEELVRNSGLPVYTLIETGRDHRLADPESLEIMLETCKKCVESPVILSRSLAEVISGFKSYMRNRLCGIVYAESNGQKKPRFEIGSGFVIEARGLYVLVTAGHVFERIAQLHQDDRLIGVSLVVPSGPRSVAELSLFPEDLATAWYSLSSDFDIAFMCMIWRSISRPLDSGPCDETCLIRRMPHRPKESWWDTGPMALIFTTKKFYLWLKTMQCVLGSSRNLEQSPLR
jgi:hypothetical protein